VHAFVLCIDESPVVVAELYKDWLDHPNQCPFKDLQGTISDFELDPQITIHLHEHESICQFLCQAGKMPSRETAPFRHASSVAHTLNSTKLLESMFLLKTLNSVRSALFNSACNMDGSSGQWSNGKSNVPDSHAAAFPCLPWLCFLCVGDCVPCHQLDCSSNNSHSIGSVTRQRLNNGFPQRCSFFR